MLSRRGFLKGCSLIAFAPAVPAFLARTVLGSPTDRAGRVLVVIQLDGGNDGINTVVPFADEGYARHRNSLRLPANQLIRLNDSVGLHPSLRPAAELLEKRGLAIVQGVGYPNPSRSHPSSMAIWHTARFDREEQNGQGWIGRALDGGPRPLAGAPASLYAGLGAPPAAIRGRRSVAFALDRLDDLALAGRAPRNAAAPGDEQTDDLAFVRRTRVDAYTTAGRLNDLTSANSNDSGYPATALARRLQLIARLLKLGFGARVFYAIQPGYDTHGTQLATHANLLTELAESLRAFLDDLTTARLAERVAVLCFSEFGRTVRENGSSGTDHGTAGPVLLAGARVQPGLVGVAPNLLDLDPTHGDLRVGIDFRRVYATVLQDWLGLPARAALGREFERLPLFRT